MFKIQLLFNSDCQLCPATNDVIALSPLIVQLSLPASFSTKSMQCGRISHQTVVHFAHFALPMSSTTGASVSLGTVTVRFVFWLHNRATSALKLCY